MNSETKPRPLLNADWPAPPKVQAFTTLRHGLGVSPAPFDEFNLGNRYSADGDSPAHVEANRGLLRDYFELPDEPRWLRQVHGVQVLRFDGEEHGTEPTADAAVSSTPGQVLAILTADCLPVLFCSAQGDEVAAAHAGWRGLCDGILEATVRSMRTPSSRLMAWLGPGAGPQAYEVGEEVREAFLRVDRQAQGAFIATREGHFLVDLYAIARQRLHAVGVTQVFGGNHCTITESERFFSHRRDRRTGRMASLIWFTR